MTASLKFETSLVHREYLPLGITRPAAINDRGIITPAIGLYFIMASRCYIRRHCIEMTAENYFRCAPAEQDIIWPRTSLKTIHSHRFDRKFLHPASRCSQSLHEKISKLPFPSGSGINLKHLKKKRRIHLKQSLFFTIYKNNFFFRRYKEADLMSQSAAGH